MRYGIFSDVHANLEALEAVITEYEGQRIDRFICVGDIVGYGADPSACIAAVRALKPVVVCGNHDHAACGLFDPANFNNAARAAAVWTSGKLNEKEAAYLRSLPFVHEGEQFTVVHGSLYEPKEFNYVLGGIDALRMFHLMHAPICFIGHSHVVGVFSGDGQTMCYSSKPLYTIEKGSKYIINVGSVGQPRDGNNRSSYAVYDDTQGEVTIQRVSYDIETAQEKILKAGLPSSLADRLLEGR